MKKILHVCSYLYPALSYGGPAKVVYDLAFEQSKNKDVEIFTSDVWDKKRRITGAEKLHPTKSLRVTYFSNVVNSWAYSQRFFTHFFMPFYFLRHLQDYRLVHVHDIFIIPQLCVVCIAYMTHMPIFFSPHGVLDPIRMKRKTLGKKILLSFVLFFLRHSSAVIATSDQEKKDLESLGISRVTRVWNGVPKPQENKTAQFDHLKKNIGRNWLYIGKLHPQKGLLELVRAFQDAPAQDTLLLAGPDDGIVDQLRIQIASQKSSNIFLLGFVDDAQKNELFSICDIFVYPSYAEGFSISVLEAFAQAMPILLTKQCNFPIDDVSFAGIVVDATRLEAELRAVFQKSEPFSPFSGECNRRIWRESFSIGQMEKCIKEIYDSVTNRD